MVVTIMPSTLSLIAKLQYDFPDIRFTAGDMFRWSPKERTVYYGNTDDTASLIHEVAHALLGHHDYERDIDLLKMERDAWEYATSTLGERYGLVIDEDVVQDSVDTYRNWLHARSACPGCRAAGLQSSAVQYTCIACNARWKVNEARSCALRRYNIPYQ
jgi:hypothetical protein